MLAPPEGPRPTDEQLLILDKVRNPMGNLMINALAGTGKTTTLKMIDKVLPPGSVLYLAFNRRVVDEVEKDRRAVSKGEKPPGDCFGPNVNIRTFNGLGHRAWGQGRKLDLDPKKMQAILRALLDEEYKGQDRKGLSEAFFDLLRAVDMAKNLGYVPEGRFPHAKRLTSKEEFHATLEEKPSSLEDEIIDTLLFLSIKSAYEGWIDFNDQIYMPTLFGAPFPRYSCALVDECQDLNPVNHEMLRKLNPSWLCAVGDPWQSIYAFRGAVRKGMERLAKSFSCEETDLSISFRCPRVIVENARWRVPKFNWIKDGGHVERLSTFVGAEIPEGSTVLCRNNAPLFALAFRLLIAKRSVSVAGSEMGPRLIGLLQKIGDPKDDSESLVAKIDAWREAKLRKANAPKTIDDMAECMKIFATFGANLTQAVAYAESLFKQQGTIKLSTGHKAKGLEWDTVFFLDSWLLDKEEQDLNLKYVIQTRAKQVLLEIDSGDLRWC